MCAGEDGFRLFFSFLFSSPPSSSESELLSLSLLNRAVDAFLFLVLASFLFLLLPSLLTPDEPLEAELDLEESGDLAGPGDREPDLDTDLEDDLDLLEPELLESEEELLPRDFERSEAESESELLLFPRILVCLDV